MSPSPTTHSLPDVPLPPSVLGAAFKLAAAEGSEGLRSCEDVPGPSHPRQSWLWNSHLITDLRGHKWGKCM